ncbi:xaa-Pro aminopeptidase 3 isoform X1 [Bactrocera dorsalis]|uniref:Xaa-Pro aminopeptidase 3 isoform X1 n=1 Tax=Bactrocera dorsalis TaxID=27457 RepID=A0ABM3JTF0_BACDO|nr:xaa-Pro aminopeptidase 3 isoform X1 [Bactrocera dorsalis]XP_049312516.1 xaa-Pro aminopeptidase 3 isoform X1 [Bactrocera dorsalis]
MSIFKNARRTHLIKTLGKFGNDHIALLSSSSSSASSSDAPAAATLSRSFLQTLRSETFGQPTYVTHPHLINEGELVIGQNVETFRERRLRLMSGIQKYAEDHKAEQQMNKSNLVIVPSASKKYMSDKIPYVFRQNSDFYYLSGCLEPDSVLLMSINEKADIKSILFMRPKDKHAEMWDGARTGVENAPDFFGVDEAYTVQQFPEILKKHITSEKPHVWYDMAASDQQSISNDVQNVAGATSAPNSPATFIQSMRLFKSICEQELMRKTCQIASRAINEVISESRPGISEHHLFAAVDYKCRMKNASYLAYPPVVAGGNNATTIHYINNTQLTKSGEMLLMDAGCEYGGYTSDITRTWPIDGTFTPAQKVLYDVLLQLQKELIGTLLKPGGETLDELFDTMCIKLGKYLQEVGIVPKDIADDNGYARAGYKFCPHHVSHYLGMDVHDTPLMPRSLRLLPGMVCTVEPGIYIAQDRKDVPKEFRGIGIRIEDDVLITSDNNVEVLTAECVKEREEVENIFLAKR